MGQHVIWCISTVAYIIVTMFLGNWRSNLGLYLAPLMIITSFVFYLSKNEEFEKKAEIEACESNS